MKRLRKFRNISMKKIDRVKKWFVEEGFDIALDKREADRIYTRKVDGDFEAHLIALSCGDPPSGFSRWSLRLLADKAVELEYIDSISHEAVWRILKKNELKPWQQKGWLIPTEHNFSCLRTTERKVYGDNYRKKNKARLGD